MKVQDLKNENLFDEKKKSKKFFKWFIIFIIIIVIILLSIGLYLILKKTKRRKILETLEYNYQIVNGVKTMLINKKQKLKKTYFAISVNVGSINDKEYNGITHILEHLVFRKSKLYNQKKFDKIINKYSGSINAMTEFNQTTFYCNFEKNGFEEILKLYLDFILDSDLTEKYFREEIENINSELLMRISQVSDYYIYDFIKTNILINKANIKKDGIKIYKNIKEDEYKKMYKLIKSIYNKYYILNNISIVILGNTKNYKQIINKLLNIYNNKKLEIENLNDNNIINSNNLGKLYFIKNNLNHKILKINYNINYDINKNDHFDFLLILFKTESKKSFSYYLKYKKNYINNYYFEIEFINNKKFIFSFKFELNKKGEENCNKIINYFYRYFENIENYKDYTEYFNYLKELSWNNYKFNIDNNIFFSINNINDDKQDIVVDYCKKLHWKNLDPNFIPYNKKYYNNFENIEFHNFIKKNFNYKNSFIIYSGSKINIDQKHLEKQDRYISSEMKNEFEYKKYNFIKNDLQNNFELLIDFKYKLDNKFKFYINNLIINKKNNWISSENRKYNLNKLIKKQNETFIPKLYIKNKYYNIYYKNYIGYLNPLINVNIDIISDYLINNNDNIGVQFKLLEIYFNQIIKINFFKDSLNGFEIKLTNRNNSINLNINLHQNNYYETIKNIFNLIYKSDINNKILENSKNILINYILDIENDSNLNYGIYELNKLLWETNNINLYKNRKLNKKLINNINETNLSNFLKKILEKTFINTLIIGNFDISYLEQINKIIDNNFIVNKGYIYDNNLIIQKNNKNINKKLKENNFLNIFQKKALKKSKDKNNIYISSYKFKLKNIKENIIAIFVKNIINQNLFDILRNKNNIGYVVNFDLIYNINYENFLIQISGDKFNFKKHEKLIYISIIDSKKIINEMKTNEINDSINNIIKSLLEVKDSLYSYSNIIIQKFKYLLYRNFNEEIKTNIKITKEEIINIFNKTIIDNNDKIILKIKSN